MRKHLRLLWVFARASIAEELTYRANLVGNLINTALNASLALLTVALFFRHAGTLGGWTRAEVIVLLGVFTVVTGLVEMVLRPGVGRIVDHIRQGTLDFVLAKPVDAQFFVSFRYVMVWRAVDVAVGLGMIGAGLALRGARPSFWQGVAFAVELLAGLLVVYSLWLGLMTLAFWFVKVDNLAFLFDSTFQAGRYPVGVYRRALRFVLTYVLPLAVVTTAPAAALIGRLTPGMALWSAVVAAVALAAARWFWARAVRAYTSASS